ncbi:MAG: TetR family transcriptional regulator C-terminal domain-containing protein [Pseudomonadota bacterium]|nr:TetR family transcriptional regulator C-terminal domain-containing protein [Pseudomonadota bacterium]MEE3101177.1 TetR family transcriptional regulator C-terminal domain-containing protein [Pseudomonadota bacterium]
MANEAGGGPAVLGSKSRRRAESDRRMLRAAIALVGQHGSVNASLAQIGLDAGYSRGLPAQRYGTKLALLEAMIDAMEGWFDQLVAARTAGLHGAEALAARIRTQMEAVRTTPGAAIALYHLIVDSTGAAPELRPRIARLHAGYRRNIRGYLLEAQERGELREDVDLDQTVRTILATISGCCLQALIDNDTERLARDADFVADLLVKRIARTG